MTEEVRGADETRFPLKRAEEMSAGGLEQIRDILFGTAHRELERRLVRAEAQLAARAQELERETRRRMEVLESHLKQETEGLLARLEREAAQTGEGLRAANRESRDAFAHLEQKLTVAAETSERGQRELRRQLLEQTKSFLDELQQLRRDLLATLQEELGLAEGELAEGPGEAEEHPRH
jgi:hypothetical protein